MRTKALLSAVMALLLWSGCTEPGEPAPDATGGGTATLTVSDEAGADFGTRLVGASADHTFTLTNTGNGEATGLGAGGGLGLPFSFKGGRWPGSGGSCTVALAAGASCTLVVSFQPIVAGSATTTLMLQYTDGSQQEKSVRRTLRGTAAVPATLTATSTSFDYGQVAVGSSRDQSFTFTNTGASPATDLALIALSGPFSFRGGGFPGIGGSCGATLAAVSSCQVVVTFTPGVSGAASGRLDVGYSDGVVRRTASVVLAGQGARPAQLTLGNGTTYDFGTTGLGRPAEHVLRITNQGELTATGLEAASLPPPFTFKGGSFPGVGGTCTTSLAGGESCVVVVDLTPTTTGETSNTLTLGFNNGLGPSTATLPVRGTGTQQAFLKVTDWPTEYYTRYALPVDDASHDFGTHAVGSSTQHVFHVTNTGAMAATSLTGAALVAPFAFKGGAFPGTGGTCTTSLAAGASCTVVVSYGPSDVVASIATVRLTYSNSVAATSATRAVEGVGTRGAALAQADSPDEPSQPGAPADFGTTSVGGPVEQTFYFTNTGATSIGLSVGVLGSGFSFKGGTFPGLGGTCGATLEAGATCSYVVVFDPTTAGPATTTLTVRYGDGSTSGTFTRELVASATLSAQLALQDGPRDEGGALAFDYGARPVGQATTHLFTVVNRGTRLASSLAPRSLGSGFTFKGGRYPGEGGTCASSLAAGSSCTLAVTFTPSTDGQVSTQLALDYEGGTGSRTATRWLSGTGTRLASLRLSSTRLGNEDEAFPFDFGTHGAQAEQTFYLRNQGAVGATSLSARALAAPFAFKGGTYPGTGGTCTTALAAGAECTLVVTFTPSGTSVGTSSSVLGVRYLDGTTTQREVGRSLSGTGTTLALLRLVDESGADFNPEPFDFGSTSRPALHFFTVRNVGARAATSLADGGALANGFGYVGGSYPGMGGTCGGSLAAGAECTLVVLFSPIGDGARGSTLTLLYNNGSSGQRTSRALVGTATSRAVLAVKGCLFCTDSGTGTYDYGITGRPLEQTFFVENAGAQTAGALTVSEGLVNGFGFKGGSYPGTGGTCGQTLEPGAQCSLVVTFSPSGDGPRSGTLALSYFDGALTASARRALAGTATTRAHLTLLDGEGAPFNPSPYDYGVTGLAKDHLFVVRNQGAQSAGALSGGASLGSGFNFKGGFYPGTGGTCTASVAPGVECKIVVTFSPSGDGLRSGTLALNYSDTAGTQQATRALRGTATSLALLKVRDCDTCDENASLPYDYEVAGRPQDNTFYVVNRGAQAATLMGSSSGLGNSFTFKGGGYPGSGGTCGTTLASGAQCTVVVSFNPSGDGLRSGTLTLAYYDGDPSYDGTFEGTSTNREEKRALIGTATTRALLYIYTSRESCRDSCGMAWFNDTRVGSASSLTLTLINVGASHATNLYEPGDLQAPFFFAGGGWPGLGGTCGTLLTAGASCTVVLEFRPTEAGTAGGTFSASFGDALGGGLEANRALAGNGL